jgi:hypothetical protein
MLRAVGRNEKYDMNASQYQYRLSVAIYVLFTCCVSQRVAGGFQISEG